MTTHDALLPAAVLQRKAVVYVRQSTPQQVQSNLEIQRRQYELVEVARRRGFKLELADAALHAKQQAIVPSARVINAIEIDDAGLHQSAQLEQMMPITAIARESR